MLSHLFLSLASIDPMSFTAGVLTVPALWLGVQALEFFCFGLFCWFRRLMLGDIPNENEVDPSARSTLESLNLPYWYSRHVDHRDWAIDGVNEKAPRLGIGAYDGYGYYVDTATSDRSIASIASIGVATGVLDRPMKVLSDDGPMSADTVDVIRAAIEDGTPPIISSSLRSLYMHGVAKDVQVIDGETA